MPLEEAPKQLDSLRRKYNPLTVIIGSEYYLASCRTLHDVEVAGRTAVSGWKKYATGEPYIMSTGIIVCGDSGTLI